MARRFRGSETFKVDAKGRVSIPASFRRVIEACDPNWTAGSRPNIVIVYGGADRSFLEVYTMEAIEEIEVIAPAIAQAQAQGIGASGPYAPDTVFMRARQGAFDVVIAMYHDQGLAPLKAVAFDTGINWTLGLPFIRTSPDHGTAFDIAGQGVADPGAMAAAILMAAEMAVAMRGERRETMQMARRRGVDDRWYEVRPSRRSRDRHARQHRPDLPRASSVTLS